jgi:hypothetical protein
MLTVDESPASDQVFAWALKNFYRVRQADFCDLRGTSSAACPAALNRPRAQSKAILSRL